MTSVAENHENIPESEFARWACFCALIPLLGISVAAILSMIALIDISQKGKTGLQLVKRAFVLILINFALFFGTRYVSIYGIIVLGGPAFILYSIYIMIRKSPVKNPAARILAIVIILFVFSCYGPFWTYNNENGTLYSGYFYRSVSTNEMVHVGPWTAWIDNSFTKEGGENRSARWEQSLFEYFFINGLSPFYVVNFNGGKIVDCVAYNENGKIVGRGKDLSSMPTYDVVSGNWTWYYDDGKKAIKASYNNDGSYTGTWTFWYPNGKKQAQGNFVNYRNVGKWKFYSPTTDETSVVQFNNQNQVTGLLTLWHQNGQKFIEGNFQNDKCIDTVKCWNYFGDLAREVQFNNQGEALLSKKYHAMSKIYYIRPCSCGHGYDPFRHSGWNHHLNIILSGNLEDLFLDDIWDVDRRIDYDENGQIEYDRINDKTGMPIKTIHYKNGMIDCVSEYTKGLVSKRTKYKDGKPVKSYK